MTYTPGARGPNAPATRPQEGKLSVGIDFGTTFSGVAYASSRLTSIASSTGGTANAEIRQILNWPGSYETYRKVPTCMLYSIPTRMDEEARILAWGLEAKNATVMDGMLRCEWFKLFLEPSALRDGEMVDKRLPALPPGKEPIDVIVDYLTCLWEYARTRITEDIGSVADLDSADVILTVPAAWDEAGCSLMREAAIKAGMVMNSGGDDKNWRDRLRIITEPEAAAIHASTLTSLHKLRVSQSFIICDAGGGTVDTAVYKLIGNLSQLEIAETVTRSGANCGSLFLDLRFRDLVRNILKDHPIHLDPPSLASFMHSFSEIDKLAYRGEVDDFTWFRFTTFNVEDGNDPAIGLEYGELSIPGHILRREVFDPVVDQVILLLDQQMRKAQQRIDCIIMVGGFSASEYLFTRVQHAFGQTVRVIARPQDCDIATLQGAARYGLGLRGGKNWVSSVISPRAYCMSARSTEVKLPAEPQDYHARPAYIIRNDAGIEVCENRLQYLVQKGAVLKKGQRVRTRFCKYARGPSDSFFTAVMYTSDNPNVFRYSDEGETFELCRWTVDLSALPDFSRKVQAPGGAFLEFDLGLELDSAEVRGVLLTDDGRECGKAVFDFLGS
ncbi:actin-like ATPase domain-containing protein [Atractiella rhizophila]|nr:actin-like ATPase domain-containing protein [Atractiella rhizophila]KAH8926674.1 actin-like ATPase domain-containing protein [Atractiella rhizophila]